MAIAPTARPDEITTADTRYRKIKVVDYGHGRIHYRRPAGDITTIGVLDVRTILIDTTGGLDDFNQAETYAAKGNPAQAVLRYERALRSVDGFWKALVRARLCHACNRGGYLDKAVTHWLAILRVDPALAAELLPTSIPSTRTRAVNTALSKLRRARSATLDPTARRLMNLLRYSVYERLDDELANELAMTVAGDPVTGPIATVPAYAVVTRALRRLFTRRRVGQAMLGLEAALADAPDAALPELLLLKGEILFAAAEDREDYIRAGWAFMRVAIHFSDGPQAGRALLWAARVHERINAGKKAVRLLHDCLALERLDSPTRASAQAALERLTAPTDD